MDEVIEFSGTTSCFIIGVATQAKDDGDAAGSAAWWIHDNVGVSFNT